MITRILRIHQNGRTIFPWWQTNYDRNNFTHPAFETEQLTINFDTGDILLNGVLMYRFKEDVWMPSKDFHRIEFLFDNSLYVIEYRRIKYEKDEM